MQSLLQAAPHVSLQLVANAETIYWQIVDPRGTYSPQALADVIHSRYDGAMVDSQEALRDGDDEAKFPFYRRHLGFGLTYEYPIPLPTHEMQRDDDLLLTISRRMTLLNTAYRERMTFSLWVMTVTPEAQKRGIRRVNEGLVINLEQADRKLFSLIEAKMAGPLYHCFLIVTVESQRPDRLDELESVANDITNSTWSGINELFFHIIATYSIQGEDDDWRGSAQALVARWVRNDNERWRDLLLVLYPEEIASFWHLPDERYTASTIAWAGVALPDEVRGGDKSALNGDRVYIGTAVGPGQNQLVVLTNKDRAYHFYTSGQTGMGKSTLMHHLIHQDIAAGRGVAVIDPHGKLIDDILAASISANRLDDVVLLECGQTDHPVPLNPCRIPEGVSYDTAFNYLYWLWRKIYERVWSEGRMDRVLRNVLRTLLLDPEATPLDIHRLLTHGGYRAELLEGSKNTECARPCSSGRSTTSCRRECSLSWRNPSSTALRPFWAVRPWSG